MSYNTGNDHQRLAEAIQEQWHHTFGVQVQLRNTEWKVHLDNVTQKNFQIGRLSWVGDFLDPLAFLDQFKYKNSDTYGGNNDTGWENPKYIEIIDKASNTVVTTVEDTSLEERLNEDTPTATRVEPAAPPRRGWWQRSTN